MSENDAPPLGSLPAAPEHGDHSSAENDGVPASAHTIGLGDRVGHPELLMSGPHPDLMHRCLNGIVE